MSDQVTIDVERAMDIVSRATDMMQVCFQENEHDAVSFVLTRMLAPGTNPLDALEEWTLDAELEFGEGIEDD